MYVEPHSKVSREVLPGDIERVWEEIKKMHAAFGTKACVALAHPQIEKEDPLRFYITREGEYENGLYINPVIERHTNYTVDSLEGCMTYPGKEAITKQRWRKIELTYQTIEGGVLTERRSKSLKGLEAAIAQHEIDHLNGIYCYDEL